MKKSWYSIKAAEPGSDTVKLSILSEIGYWGVNAIQFDRDFKAARGNATKCELTINSPGGDVFEGISILHILRASGLEIGVRVLGVAASIASVIAMAGDKIVMPKNTMMFVHNPISGVWGNAEQMRERAEDLDKVKQSINATYLARFKKDEKDLDALLARETYLTADECLEYGFCDEVIDAIPMEAKFDIEQLPESVQALFRREPAADPVPSTPLASRIAEAAAAAGLDDYKAFFAMADNFEAAQRQIADATEIVAMGKVFGDESLVPGLIRARKSVVEARKAFSEALLASDAGAPVSNTQPSPKGQPPVETQFNAQTIWQIVRDVNKPQPQRSV